MKDRNLKILGQKWAVQYIDTHPMLLNEKNSLDMGASDFEHSIIYICTVFNEDIQQSTLLHEISEVVGYCLGLDTGEDNIKRWEAGLFQVLHDNKLRF